MIEIWKEIVGSSAAFYVGWGGLLIGVAFGFVVYRTNFCTMGLVSDILSFGDYRRFRSWLLAIAVAVLGVGLLQMAGILNPADSMYMTPNFGWAVNVAGGLIFGVGMVFSGGCISKNLVRAGGGDLRSFMVLIITGVFAFITIFGLLGPLRLVIFAPLTADLTQLGLQTQGIGDMLAYLTGLPSETGGVIALVVVSLVLLGICFKDPGFRSSPVHLIVGVGIGVLVVVGWLLTGLAFDEFANAPLQPISLTFVRPTGDSLDYLMRFTALGAPGFGVVTLLGTILGGTLAALSSNSFHLATFADTSDTLRNVFGAAMMGIGGVLALGCTIGQGLTGFSTLAMGSVITFVFIILGGIVGMKAMERFI